MQRHVYVLSSPSKIPIFEGEIPPLLFIPVTKVCNTDVAPDCLVRSLLFLYIITLPFIRAFYTFGSGGPLYNTTQSAITDLTHHCDVKFKCI